MICVVIKGPSYAEVHSQISQASNIANLVELRLDLFEKLDFITLEKIKKSFSIPMIFTLRKNHQEESARQKDILRLLEIQPDYLDLESDVPDDFFAKIHSHYLKTKLILSYHNFFETPRNLKTLLNEMIQKPAWGYKIAVTAKNAIDGLRLMCFAKTSAKNLIAISMGSHGKISRIIGSPLTYACLSEEQSTAAGQLSTKILLERYRYPKLTSETSLYGLIGDPVDQSISDETHNHFFETQNLNAVYVKIPVKATELKEFLALAKKVPFKGLSVTMPLKESILPFLDQIDDQAAKIGAVNTLVLHEKKWIGFNTDGIGALNVVEKETSVKGKRVVIIGAGGAAKAIAFEMHRKGAFLTFACRDKKKAQLLAMQYHGQAFDLTEIDKVKLHYDIIINCIPHEMPIKNFFAETLVMDIKTKPKNTLFLRHALKNRCKVIYGYQMFVEQALYQFKLWFTSSFFNHSHRQILIDKSLKSLENKLKKSL